MDFSVCVAVRLILSEAMRLGTIVDWYVLQNSSSPNATGVCRQTYTMVLANNSKLQTQMAKQRLLIAPFVVVLCHHFTKPKPQGRRRAQGISSYIAR
jgi:hypothetical protein